ncbi:RidA family protein [Kitasatospora acidiphila]|uniref:RidA family protein n=1 Tax=Kitasatospora acidiphila TaxID=2567942 RepID=A0A540VZZ2_9ACTN|nr:RidA family protein [Kitasatospora acidiphila]TQF02335.1 RidA family protein [Kitasatospora acidiphila]
MSDSFQTPNAPGTPVAPSGHLVAPAGLAPGNGYSHVSWGTGRVVAVSGQLALDESGALVGPGDPDAQAGQVFENIRRALAAAGAEFTDVIKLNFYITDTAYLPALRAARDAVIDTANPPASSAVVVAGLIRPEFLVEVDALAVLPLPAPEAATAPEAPATAVAAANTPATATTQATAATPGAVG